MNPLSISNLEAILIAAAKQFAVTGRQIDNYEERIRNIEQAKASAVKESHEWWPLVLAAKARLVNCGCDVREVEALIVRAQEAEVTSHGAN